MSDRAVQYEYQKRTRFGLLLWFLRRNFLNIFSRLLIFSLVLWLCFFGGIKWLITGWLDSTKKISSSNTVQSSPEKSPDKVSSFETTSFKGEGAPVVVPEGSLKEFNEEKTKSETYIFPYKPAFFYNGKCFLRNGLEISVGYVFEKGTPYAGKKVSKIDFKGRFFVLDGAYTVSMF